MYSKNLLLAVLAAVSAVNAQEYLGFNYGSTHGDGSARSEADFTKEFTAAQNIALSSGKFSSARLYTMVQAGAQAAEPISAIPAAIKTKTTLLLGLWTSGTLDISKEINALTNAIKQYGDDFTELVVGLSVGSEDLYRNSVMGIEAEAGIGAQPSDIVRYIGEVKTALKGTKLSNVPIGHVDTWTAWVNGSNAEVINAVDWLGFDAYPYFQSTMSNSIDVASTLFWEAYDNTAAVSGGKEVWITETGWPTSGKTFNLAKADVPSAQAYWKDVGCRIFGKYKTWWYILEDTGASPSFGVLESDYKTPHYDLSCKGIKPGRVAVAQTSSSASYAPKTTSTSSRENVESESASRSGSSTFAVVTSSPGTVSGNSEVTPTASSGAAATTGADGASAASSVFPAGTASILLFQMFTFLGAMTIAAIITL